MWSKGQSLESPPSLISIRERVSIEIYFTNASITHSLQTHTRVCWPHRRPSPCIEKTKVIERSLGPSLPPSRVWKRHACKRCLARGQDPFTWKEKGWTKPGGGSEGERERESREGSERKEEEEEEGEGRVRSIHSAVEYAHAAPMCTSAPLRASRGAVALKAGAVARSAPPPLNWRQGSDLFDFPGSLSFRFDLDDFKDLKREKECLSSFFIFRFSFSFLFLEFLNSVEDFEEDLSRFFRIFIRNSISNRGFPDSQL